VHLNALNNYKNSEPWMIYADRLIPIESFEFTTQDSILMMTPNASTTLSIPFISKDNSITPIIDIDSDNTSIVSINNVLINDNNITCTITSGSILDTTTITITANYNNEIITSTC
jgi:hypothetical protein